MGPLSSLATYTRVWIRAARPWVRSLREGMILRGRAVLLAAAAGVDRLLEVPPRRLAAVAAGAVGALVLAVPLLGLSDEALAMIGERVFGVGELPSIAAPNQRSVLLDVNGERIGILTGPENRTPVALDEIPQVLRDAVIAVEDHDFWDHEGVQVSAIVRAGMANVLAQEVEQGGSTITQQYVKLALLSNERSIARKVTEATWAVRLEQRLPKDEILERYLNLAYFGNGAYGVATASERYFSLSVDKLDLARSALLAGLIQLPGAHDPIDNPAAAASRRDVVLDRMVAEGLVTPNEADDARVPIEELLDVSDPPSVKHDFFVEHLKQVLLAAPELGDTREERAQLLFGGGLTVRTTIDVRLQRAAEQAIRERLEDPAADPMAGLASVEPATGAVRVMAVGPKTFGACKADDKECTRSKLNPMVAGLGGSGRQVGSAFKPLVVTAALDNGAGTDWHTDVSSGQTIAGCDDYAPENHDRSGGIDDMVEAITESNNVFHVKLAEHVGQDTVVDMAHRLGVDTSLEPWCAIALGVFEAFPLEMAEAYATLANRGVHCESYSVVEVLDRSGKPLLRREPRCERVVEAEVADTVTALLEEVAEDGTAQGAAIGLPIAAKTGTTVDNRDAWLIGYTRELATAAWVGYEQPTPMEGILGYRTISGGTVPAEIWSAYMRAAMEIIGDARSLGTADLEEYRQPSCPSPPDRDDDDDRKGKGKKKRGKNDPSDGSIETNVDGDDFEDGHQPEVCIP